MSATRLRKGTKVRFQFGTRFVEGVIKEDRGPIGVKGRHLYLVKFAREPESEAPSEVELPAEEFQVTTDAGASD